MNCLHPVPAERYKHICFLLRTVFHAGLHRGAKVSNYEAIQYMHWWQVLYCFLLLLPPAMRDNCYMQTYKPNSVTKAIGIIITLYN